MVNSLLDKVCLASYKCSLDHELEHVQLHRIRGN